ncbi:MAG: (4-{4-[2-(gamma-L-glutamylamino)ethyl]phenoxymethyl}furan-2-yl)methanamine synthase [Methanonatronarchaeales archaeon]|nr:(4-{4-[2-(gamma-L-glutamylamino)ethyl]phenoxymethyl}furan-2-yl)methanamine synthase [Methanonatronarchaeales archaeon]
MLGIDVGGANLKIVSGEGIRSAYTPLWTGEGRRRLGEELSGAGDVAAVMTGELVDAYDTRRDGVLSILDALEAADGEVVLYGYDGFAAPDEARQDPLAFAGANWKASEELVESEMGDCVLMDVGSTTCDVVPVGASDCRSDLERLAARELVYSGALRTDLTALTRSVEVRGADVPLAKERFAVTGDAYLVLGDIGEADYATETPDGGPKTGEAARRRLAHTVCSDTEELDAEEIVSIAEQFRDVQIAEVAEAAEVQAARADAETAAICGTGDFLARKAAEMAGLEVIDLKDLFGDFAETLPAHAVRELALRRGV